MNTALKKFYGGASALAGHVGGQERIQEVWTPQWIIDIARQTLGGEIDLDPCAASNPEAHFAKVNITLPQDSTKMRWSVPGIRNAYVNPPFKELSKWMARCSAETIPIVALYPVRTHRNWFMDLLVGNQVSMLSYNVKFQGHDSAFPAALCLVAYRCEIKFDAKRMTWQGYLPSTGET